VGCQLEVEIIGAENAAGPALSVIGREAAEEVDAAGSGRRFDFPSAGCEELKATLAELLDREAPGWRDQVRF
jgi:hypothetical protein